MPLNGLMGQMKTILNNLSEHGLLQIAPADVSGLFTTAELSAPDLFLEALQSRFLNDTIKPKRLASLQDFLKSRSPIEESDIRKSIRLIMCTPEYQLT